MEIVARSVQSGVEFGKALVTKLWWSNLAGRLTVATAPG